jgi:hypothetical protein
MKQRITDIIKTLGENDGICSRIYVDGFKHNGWDILSVAWSYEDENLLVFLQDENDRYTDTEWFDSLPYLTQIQICADIESCFGTEFDSKDTEPIKTDTDMEKKIKREMLLEMIDYALKHDADGMRNLQNEILLSWSGCTYDTIETNDEDGLRRLFETYLTYEIVESVAGGYYNPTHPYATIHHGELHTFININEYFDKEFVADFLMAKEDYLNLNDFFCQTCGDEGYYDYCDIFIKHYLRFNTKATDLKARKAVVNVFNDWNNFLYFSWEELNDNVRSSTKEDVFDDMRNILKDREDKIVWFADDKCVLHQYYYGTIEKMFVVSVRLVKNLQGEDMILQDVDYCEDGSPNPERIIDDVMHLNFKEMQELYELMLKNI